MTTAPPLAARSPTAGDSCPARARAAAAPGNRVRARVVLVVVGVFVAVIVHRPLPPELAAQTMSDRVKMHFIEPVLRFSYYYPSRVCPDATCMLKWTRFALSTLSRLFSQSPAARIRVAHEQWNGVTVRVYVPGNRSSDAAVIFIHGGGFVIGDAELYDSLTAELTDRLDMVLVSLEYRLAPEAPFPAGLEDCERAVERFLTDEHRRFGVDPRRVVLMGDSAGGNLVTVIAQRFRLRHDLHPLRAQVLIYPLLQFSDLLLPSYQQYYREMDGLALVVSDPVSIAFYYMMYAGIDMDANPEFAYAATHNRHLSPIDRVSISDTVLDVRQLPIQYIGEGMLDRDRRFASEHHPEATAAISRFVHNPDFAPLMQRNLSGLPQTLIVTCEFDVLRDEGAIYAERLRRANVQVTWKHYPRGFHAMLNFYKEIAIASEALDYIAEWVRGNVLDNCR